MQPVLRLFAPIPTIGLVPLAILWFGLGEESKAIVVALGVFVPVWINSHAGLSTTPGGLPPGGPLPGRLPLATR